MLLRDRRAPPQPARGSTSSLEGRSFLRRSAVWTDRGVRARPEASDAGARKVRAGRGLEVSRFDAGDGTHDDVAAALQVTGLEDLLSIFLQAGRPPHGEDVLAHRAPYPVLRVPQRQEPWLESERLSLVVESVPAGEVIKGQLDVIQLGSEVRLIRPAHRLARTRLVVDHLHLAVAHVVDAVDLAYDLGPVQLEVEPPLEGQGAHAADRLHAGDEANVVAEKRAHLLLLALAVERPLHAREVALELLLQHLLEPLLLPFRLELPPLRLLQVKVLQDLVQEAPALHRHRPRLLGQPRMVVVPV